jgi:hypothetical protein
VQEEHGVAAAAFGIDNAVVVNLDAAPLYTGQEAFERDEGSG